MRKVLASGKVLDEAFRRTLHASIGTLLVEQLRAKDLALEGGEVSMLLFADVCDGCPSGHDLEHSISDADPQVASLAIFIPETYKSLLRELQIVDGVYALGYGQSDERLNDLLSICELLGVDYPLEFHLDQARRSAE